MLYKSNDVREGRICLFDSQNNFVEQVAKFSTWLWSLEVATTSDKVSNYGVAIELTHIIQIFGINPFTKSFEIYDLNTRQISRGLTNKLMNDRFKESYRSKSS